MKSVLAIAFLLCLVALSVEGYIGYGSYYGGLGGFGYGGYGLGGYGGYGLGGYGGYGYGIPHYGHYGRRLYYNPVHGLHSHGSFHDYDHAVY